MLKINEELSLKLKKPLGKLYPDFADAIEDINKSKYLISVGDATLKNLISHNIIPNIGIIDNKIQRTPYDHKIDHTTNILNANNPPGTISDNLWETIEIAVNNSIENNENYIIVVDGEEDLAVLPTILIAPEDTIVLYGQPNEGLVLLNVSNLKDKAREFIDDFTKV